MERESKVGSRVRGQHTGAAVAVVVDEQRVLASFPRDAVRGIRYDGIERLEVSVPWIQQRVAQLDVEIVVVDVMQKHVDTTKVVGGGVDLLTIILQRRVLPSDGLRELQQQRARATGRVVDASNLVAVGSCQASQKFTHLLRREELAARLSCIRGVHGHQELVGIAEGINLIVSEFAAQVHVAHLQQHLCDELVTRLHVGTQLRVVHVEVVEKPLHVVFAFRSYGRAFNIVEYLRERHVQVLVMLTSLAYIDKQLRGQDEEPLFLHNLVFGGSRLFVVHVGIVEAFHASFLLQAVYIVGKIFGNKAVEERSQHVCLEFPSTHGAAQFVGNVPDGAVQFRSLLFVRHISLYSIIRLFIQSAKIQELFEKHPSFPYFFNYLFKKGKSPTSKYVGTLYNIAKHKIYELRS